ncbi:MAG: UvrD-helicase domain-containing protein [Bacteroidia bacterium]
MKVSDIVEGLSKPQQEAVTASERRICVLAAAGTSKTEVLSRRVAYLIAEKKINPAFIVAFTFTEKAAQNLFARIHQCIDLFLQAKGHAKPSLNQMYIGTIHAYALKIIKDYFVEDYDLLDEHQEYILRYRKQIGFDKIYSKFVEKEDNIEKFKRDVNLVWNELISQESLQTQAPEFYESYERYQQLLRRHKLLTYGKCIALAVEKLLPSRNKVPHVQYLLVDEYQDINKAQYELIELLAKDGYLYGVGDPRQTIYPWRGARDNYISNEKLFDKTYHLKENRRSAPKIVDVANAFAKKVAWSLPPMQCARSDEEGFVGLKNFSNEQEEAHWIVEQIKKLKNLNAQELNYQNIGLLTRQIRNNKTVNHLTRMLREKGIPYVLRGSLSLFKNREAKVMATIFKWLVSEKENLLSKSLKEWKGINPPFKEHELDSQNKLK